MFARQFMVAVCPVVPFPPQTGAQKRTLRLLEAAARSGVTPHVLTFDPFATSEQQAALEARGWQLDLVQDPPTSVARAQAILRRRPSAYLERLAARLRALVSERPAWVQLEHGWSAQYLRDLVGVRTLWSLHNLDSEMLRSSASTMPVGLARARDTVRWRAMRATERWAAGRADVVVCVNDDELALLDRLGARTMLIPNGVDPGLLDIPEQPPSGEDVLFFGQLRYAPNRRGIDRFLRDGWPAVAAARPQARLRIVGEGADEQLTHLIGATPGAELVGLVPEIAFELARAAIVVVPVWEGAGTRLKVLEALAAARPVVGTSLGVSGIGFADGRHGVVADDPAGIASATVQLLAAEPRRAAIGQAARLLASKFAWDVVTSPLQDLYREWAARARGPAPATRPGPE